MTKTDTNELSLARAWRAFSVRARRSLVCALLAVIVSALATCPAAAQHHIQPKARNIVYVESNDPNGNAILAFSRTADGSLTALPGSPFPTGGLGTNPTFALGPFDGDQQVVVNRTGTMLFAVDGGSHTIAAFTIKNDGSLRAVEGSPFPSGGTNPVSIGLAGNFVCVANQGQDPNQPIESLPNYTTLRLGPTGKLAPVAHSTFRLDLGASPEQALPAAGGRIVFGCDFLGGTLRSFRLNSDGRLSLRAALGIPPDLSPSGTLPLPLGLAAHPTLNVLYVGLVTINQIAVYRYSANGGLRFDAAVPDTGNGVCWLTINTKATRLYASNTGDPSISVYDIETDPLAPIQIQKVPMKSTGGGFQFRLDSTDSFLHVVTQQSGPTSTVEANAIHVFKVAGDGTLSEVASSPTILSVPNLVRPQGVAAL
jgi:6-phosphogluconolactonase (cycloisomerase 2 family)